MPLEPRAFLKSVSPYVLPETTLPGDERVIQLASNESAFPPSPKAMAVLAGLRGDDLRLYPPAGGPRLRAALAERHGLAAERLVFGNGSGELINLICRSFLEAGREGVMSAHGYPYFKTAMANTGARVIAVPEIDLRPDYEGILKAVGPETRVVLLANPNNPTGYHSPMAAVRAFHKGLPEEVLLVLDEAYADYLPDQDDNDSGFALADEAENVAVLRTFSKVFGLAGLRVGWCYGPPLLCNLLNQLREASNISLEGEMVALAAFRDEAYTENIKAKTIATRCWFGAALGDLGLRVHPSETNFLLVSLADGRAGALHAHLRARRILARPMAPHGLPDSLRFTIGPRADLEVVLAAIEGFLSVKA